MLLLSPMERALDILKYALGPALEIPLRSIAERTDPSESWVFYFNGRRRVEGTSPVPRRNITLDGPSPRWTPDNVLSTLYHELDQPEMRAYFKLRTDAEVCAFRCLVQALVAAKDQWSRRDDGFNLIRLNEFLQAESNLLRMARLSEAAEECKSLFPKILRRDPRELESLPEPERSNLSISDHLIRLGVPRYHQFGDSGFPDVVAVDDIVELWRTPGADGTGLAPEKIKSAKSDGGPRLPAYIFKARDAIPVPEWNSPLAFVNDWQAPISDVGGDLILGLADGDWHIKQSLEKCRSKLHPEMERRNIQLGTFPGFISLSVSVEAMRDSKFILCRRTAYLADEPKEWCIGIGETMHREKDQNGERGLHPHNTVLRGMFEELGLVEELRTATFSYLAGGLSIYNFSINLFCHARIDMASQALIDVAYARAKDTGEWDRIEAVECSLATCIQLLTAGHWAKDPGSPVMLPVASWSRLAVLYFAQARFGPTAVHQALAMCRRQIQ